jgi:hypothetical protein
MRFPFPEFFEDRKVMSQCSLATGACASGPGLILGLNCKPALNPRVDPEVTREIDRRDSARGRGSARLLQAVVSQYRLWIDPAHARRGSIWPAYPRCTCVMATRAVLGFIRAGKPRLARTVSEAQLRPAGSRAAPVLAKTQPDSTAALIRSAKFGASLAAAFAANPTRSFPTP